MFESKHEREGGDFCGTVRSGIVVEFSCGEEFCPFLGVIGAEDSEIDLNFLVGLFIEGGRWSKGRHHNGVTMQVSEQMQRQTIDLCQR